MNPEILLFREMLEDGVRYHPDPRLNRRSVVDQLRDIMPDPVGHFIRLRRRPGEQRDITLDYIIDLLEMDETIPQRARHALVDLGYDQLGVLGPRLDHVDRYTERAESVVVGRRHLYQRHVDLEPSRMKQLRELGKEDRRVFGPSLVHRVPYVLPDEERVLVERLAEDSLRVGRRAELDQVDRFVILDVGALLYEDLDEGLRFRGARTDEDPAARLDQSYEIVDRLLLLLVEP